MTWEPRGYSSTPRGFLRRKAAAMEMMRKGQSQWRRRPKRERRSDGYSMAMDCTGPLGMPGSAGWKSRVVQHCDRILHHVLKFVWTSRRHRSAVPPLVDIDDAKPLGEARDLIHPHLARAEDAVAQDQCWARADIIEMDRYAVSVY